MGHKPSLRTRTKHAGAALLALSAAATPAFAHHPTGGRTPTTFLEGLLSGIGHPVIGLDHLAFIVAIGIAAALVRSGPALIAAFLAASMAGVLAHVARLDLPLVEPLVALSVIAAGLLIALRGVAGQGGWMALAAAAGLFHGYAFGESIVGAERAVVGAYLVGIALVASAIAGSVMLAMRRLPWAADALARRQVVAGSAVGAVGVGFLALSLMASS